MKYLKKKQILEYLIIFFPFSLITGPLIPELILLISIILFLILIYEKNDFNFLINDFSKIFLIFYFLIVIRSFFVDESLFSLKNTLFYFRFLIFALIIKYLILNNIKFINYLIISLIIMLSIISIDAIVEYLVGSHWLFDKGLYSENDNYRTSGLFDEEYILGGFILAFFPSILLLVNDHLKCKKNYKIFFIVIFFIIFASTIVISGERASLAKMVLLFIFIIFFTKIFGKLKSKMIAIILMISFISILVVSQPKLNERLIYHTVDLILQNKDQKKIDRNLSIYEYFESVNLKNLNFTYYSNEHRDHAIISINMFKDKFIFGHGVKMFRFKCSKDEYYINDRACSTHSHGIFFTFISELGIIGTIFLIMIYYHLIKSILTTNKNFEKVILLTILIYLFPFIPSGYFFNNFFSLVLYFLVGIYLGKKKLN
jgi:O-antigen ligase